MSIQTDNEVDRLFSLALGDDWIRAALLARTSEELSDVESLACDNVDNALHQIAAIGNTLGAEQVEKAQVSRLGWAVAHLAEYANVVNVMAGMAREMKDPEIRALNETVVKAEKERNA